MSANGRGPGVKYPPPIPFAVSFLVGWLVDRYRHLWPDMPPEMARRVDLIGWLMILGGLSFAFWALSWFWKVRTPVYPNRDARKLVVDGPYLYSRNPMYTGIITAYIGGCAIIDSFWPAVLLPIPIALLYTTVVRKEERHLTEEFGEQYRQYQREVRRWL